MLIMIIIIIIIIKITISSLVIGFKKSYFPLIRLPSCYRTVCYWTVCYRIVQKANHIQRCSLNQPITFKVVTRERARALALFCVFAGSLRMFTPPLYGSLMPIFPFFLNLAIFLFLGNCNFYD